MHTRMVKSNETTTDRVIGPYSPKARRSMLSRRTELLVGTRTVTSRHADARACPGVTAHQVTLQIGQSISIVNV